MSTSSEVLTENEVEILRLFPEGGPEYKGGKTSVELAQALSHCAGVCKDSLDDEVIAVWKRGQSSILRDPSWDVFLEKEEVLPDLYLFKEKYPGFFGILDKVYVKAKSLK